MLTIGQSVPPFSLTTQSEEALDWGSLRGKAVVVFFYPKANTPGCTKEAIAFEELRTQLEQLNVTVIGVSADTVKRQFNFATKHSLSMPLVADTERELIESWGVWQEKKNYGKTYMGIVRSTFLFDTNGILVQKWSPVKLKGHVDAVFAACVELQGKSE